MGNHMYHSLINPYQLCHYGIKVQDSSMWKSAISIITQDNEFCMEVATEGTVVYAVTFTPSEQELHQCPHIILQLPRAWDPHNVVLHRARRTLEEDMGALRHVSTMYSTGGAIKNEDIIEDVVFSIYQMNSKISLLKILELGKPSIDPGKSDVPIMHKFKSSDRQLDVTAQDLSEIWGISISTAANILLKTTQKFLRIAILPLSRIYRTDQLFTRKTLRGYWSTGTIDARCKSLEGNRYTQVFVNKAFFFCIYPMDSKNKAVDALRLFCQEFGVPERLTFDSSKE